jgi:hypothetical protein
MIILIEINQILSRRGGHLGSASPASARIRA